MKDIKMPVVIPAVDIKSSKKFVFNNVKMGQYIYQIVLSEQQLERVVAFRVFLSMRI